MTTTYQENATVKAELDRLTEAFYRAVTFKPGEKPDYQVLHALFIERGLLIRNITDVPEITSVTEFIAPRQKLFDSGDMKAFREAELYEITEIFGKIAHRLSTYEKQGVNQAGAFEARGVVSIQFILTPDGWKMSGMVWDDEREGLTIPERYKPKDS